MSNVCSVAGCGKPSKKKGLCGAHYERLRVHGDVTVNKRVGQRVPSVPCSVEGCRRKATSSKSGLCNVHYLRKYRHGGIESKIPNYGSHKVIHEQGYVRIWTGKRYEMEHVLLAEKALGKPLPPGAVVHHMNNKPADNHTPFNLVVCPDQAYHMLLHKRARELGYE